MLSKLREFRHLLRIQPGDVIILSGEPSRFQVTRIEPYFTFSRDVWAETADDLILFRESSQRLESVKPLGLSHNRVWRFK